MKKKPHAQLERENADLRLNLQAHNDGDDARRASLSRAFGFHKPIGGVDTVDVQSWGTLLDAARRAVDYRSIREGSVDERNAALEAELRRLWGFVKRLTGVEDEKVSRTTNGVSEERGHDGGSSNLRPFPFSGI